MTVTNLVAVHLKNLYRGKFRVFKQVVKLQVSAEDSPLVLEGDITAVGDVSVVHGCLLSADNTG